jgi:hypothetical protein
MSSPRPPQPGAPNPGSFTQRRSTKVPTGVRRPARYQPHGFQDHPQCGHDGSAGQVDTGLFFALGACNDHQARIDFLLRYQGRLNTGPAVRSEVQRWAATNVVTHRDDADKIAAAKRAVRALLAGSHIATNEAVADHIVNGVFAQLDEYEAAGEWHFDPNVSQPTAPSGSTRGKHAGEAELIAYAIAANEPCILLTNDAGASAVADNRGVPARHFGHVLREIVCHSEPEVSPDVAVTYYQDGSAVSHLRSNVAAEIEGDPQGWMTCHKMTTGECIRCGRQPAGGDSQP